MILTFEEIKANARANYKPTPKVEFKQETNLEKPIVIIGMFISLFLTVYCFIGG